MSSEQPAPLVPRLRFPEFQAAGAWTMVPLGSIAAVTADRVGDADCVPMSVTSGVGLVSQEDKFGRVIAGDSLKNYLRLRTNDFAYNKSSTKEYPEGFLTLYSGDGPAAVPASIFTCFRLQTDQVVPSYLNHLFAANLHGKWLRQVIQVGARAHGSLSVTDKDLMALPVPLPKGFLSREEQQKISDCLNSLDELIAAKGRRVDALKAQKNGLMRELLPRERETQPRYRFLEFESTGPWVERTLSDLLEIKHGYAFEGEFYSTSGDHVLLTPGNFCEQGGYRDRGVNQKYYVGPILRDYVLNRGDLLVAMTEQAAGLLGSPIIVPSSNKFLHNQRLGLLKTREDVALTSDFLFHVFNTQRVRAAISASASGAKVRHTSPNKIGEVVFAFPSSFEEQRRIASCLGDLDGLIAQEVRELDTLQMHKKALTQQLFQSTAALAA